MQKNNRINHQDYLRNINASGWGIALLKRMEPIHLEFLHIKPKIFVVI